VNQNQYQRVGIDGLLDPNNVDLSNRCVVAVREALIRAGVPASKIQYGAFGDPQQRLDGKVAVLVSK
jgi:outer membrane protein OmpA-like peptidoglycan-associated protein